MSRIAKISILTQEGIIKKFPFSVAAMSRYMKRDYLRLCPEKRRKKIQAVKGQSYFVLSSFPLLIIVLLKP